jgi:23S rRNA (cytidine1920-2'-O)/16S rRNA (cytidine1409-2'-O)-methyltransferase
MKTRLDKLLVDRGLVPSRERAQALILAGKVLVNEQKLSKSGAAVNDDVIIRLLEPDLKYVSRGGLKLEKALAHWHIPVEGRTCIDVGASTGGFTDCLLQHGAARVIAIDTGYGQLAFGLRQDPRVLLLEKTNARHLIADDLSRALNDSLNNPDTNIDPVNPTPRFADLIVIDVSFISATLVLPAVIAAAFPAGPAQGRGRHVVVLVKPQFEAGREHVGKGGIVRDEAAQLAAVEKVKNASLALGATRTDFIDSPILGAEGNREFLLYAEF